MWLTKICFSVMLAIWGPSRGRSVLPEGVRQICQRLRGRRSLSGHGEQFTGRVGFSLVRGGVSAIGLSAVVDGRPQSLGPSLGEQHGEIVLNAQAGGSGGQGMASQPRQGPTCTIRGRAHQRVQSGGDPEDAGPVRYRPCVASSICFGDMTLGAGARPCRQPTAGDPERRPLEGGETGPGR